MSNRRFALIGAAGYIAERHMRAIKETGNELLCAMDTYDVMGRIDSYFPYAEFFQDENKLELFLVESRKKGTPIDFVSICSPNYLHLSHIELALKNGCNVICEKPMVLSAEELDKVKNLEARSGKRVFTILQLRYHATILKLKEEIENSAKQHFNIELKYITTRGKWYFKSWKGDTQKSGGVATNIGIHFFDMLTWIFGAVQENIIHVYEADKATGFLQLEKARVRWFLSLDENDLPPYATNRGMRTFRSITVDKEELEFSGGFTDLHTVAYQNILKGNGFGVDDARESIELVESIR